MIQDKRMGMQNVVATHLVDAVTSHMGRLGQALNAQYLSTGRGARIHFQALGIQATRMEQHETIDQFIQKIDKKIVHAIRHINQSTTTVARQVDQRFAGIDNQLGQVKSKIQSIELHQRHLQGQIQRLMQDMNTVRSVQLAQGQQIAQKGGEAPASGGFGLGRFGGPLAGLAGYTAARSVMSRFATKSLARGALARFGVPGAIAAGAWWAYDAYTGASKASEGGGSDGFKMRAKDPKEWAEREKRRQNKDIFNVEAKEIFLESAGDISLHSLRNVNISAGKTLTLEADKIVLKAKDIQFSGAAQGFGGGKGKSGGVQDILKRHLERGSAGSPLAGGLLPSPDAGRWGGGSFGETPGTPSPGFPTRPDGGPGGSGGWWSPRPGAPGGGGGRRSQYGNYGQGSPSDTRAIQDLPSLPSIPGYENFRIPGAKPGEPSIGMRQRDSILGPGSASHFMEMPNFMNRSFDQGIPSFKMNTGPDPSTYPDFRGQGGAAALRYNNPGAHYPGGIEGKIYGSSGSHRIGGGHLIAEYPDAVTGAAANMALFNRAYTGMRLDAAISKWSGGNNVGTYLNIMAKHGFSRDMVVSPEMMKDPNFAASLLKAKMEQEVGKGPSLDRYRSKMTDEHWKAAHSMFMEKTYGVKAGGNGGPGSISFDKPGGDALRLRPGEGGGPVGSDGNNRITHDNQGIRNRPVSSRLNDVLNYAAQEAGVDRVSVWSGGQPSASEGGRRTGSTRHDHGNAADVDLYVGGRKLDERKPEDRAIMEKFTEAASRAGAHGIGGPSPDYMGHGRMHIGFGKPATWNEPDWTRSAWERGRSNPVNLEEWKANQQNQGRGNRVEGLDGGVPERPSMVDSTKNDYGVGGTSKGLYQEKVRGLTFHDTAGSTLESALEQLGKDGNAYNYIMDKDGTIHQLTAEGYRGQHMKNSPGGLGNHNMEGISVVGPSGGDYTAKQKEKLAEFVAWHSKKHGYDPKKNTFGHGELNPDRRNPREGFGFLDPFRKGEISLPKPSRPAAPIKESDRERYEKETGKKSQVPKMMGGVEDSQDYKNWLANQSKELPTSIDATRLPSFVGGGGSPDNSPQPEELIQRDNAEGQRINRIGDKLNPDTNLENTKEGPNRDNLYPESGTEQPSELPPTHKPGDAADAFRLGDTKTAVKLGAPVHQLGDDNVWRQTGNLKVGREISRTHMWLKQQMPGQMQPGQRMAGFPMVMPPTNPAGQIAGTPKPINTPIDSAQAVTPQELTPTPSGAVAEAEEKKVQEGEKPIDRNPYPEDNQGSVPAVTNNPEEEAPSNRGDSDGYGSENNRGAFDAE
jgi:hypothetical protein